mmetsp:Transcript_29601/g.54529  ORF Transcript_29601/g.54529 Transcript_29601/m.54529 type:complete len:235 (+) Transcript_29601:1689-2393(+)
MRLNCSSFDFLSKVSFSRLSFKLVISSVTFCIIDTIEALSFSIRATCFPVSPRTASATSLFPAIRCFVSFSSTLRMLISSFFRSSSPRARSFASKPTASERVRSLSARSVRPRSRSFLSTSSRLLSCVNALASLLSSSARMRTSCSRPLCNSRKLLLQSSAKRARLSSRISSLVRRSPSDLSRRLSAAPRSCTSASKAARKSLNCDARLFSIPWIARFIPASSSPRSAFSVTSS